VVEGLVERKYPIPPFFIALELKKVEEKTLIGFSSRP
jgi:hypothetical protein